MMRGLHLVFTTALASQDDAEAGAGQSDQRNSRPDNRQQSGRDDAVTGVEVGCEDDRDPRSYRRFSSIRPHL